MSATTIVPRNPLGQTGLSPSILSLGSWHTYDRMDFHAAAALLRKAVDAGINLFDVGVYGTADTQPPPITDILFSAMVRAAGLRREDYLLSSKLWLDFYDERGFRPQLERALYRVGVDYADLVILGDLRRNDLSLRDLVLDLAGLRKAGLIRAWGVNNWSAGSIRSLIDISAAEGVEGPQLAQLKYSVARRSIPDGEPFAALFADGFAMQSSDVMEGGILAGKTSPAREVGRDPGGIRERIVATAEPLARLAASYGASAAQVCIAFALSHPNNVSTLFGATRLEQLDQAIAAIGLLERIGAEELRAAVEPFWCDRGIVDPEGP